MYPCQPMSTNETTQEPEGLWDSAKLARFLDVPPKTLDQWSYRKTGPPHLRVGRHRRYRPADVRRWLEQQEAAG